MPFPFLLKVQIDPVKKKMRKHPNPEQPFMRFFFSFPGGTLPHGGVVLGLEPLDYIGLVDAVGGTNVGLAPSALGDTKTRAGPTRGKTLAPGIAVTAICLLMQLIHTSPVNLEC